MQFFRYFFSGGSAFLLYLFLLFVFTEYLHIYHLVSLIIAYSTGIFLNFFISKRFVFSSGQKSSFQIVKFFGVGLVGLCLQYGFVWASTNFLNLYYLYANIIASAVVYVVSFSLNRWFTFQIKS